MLSKQKSRKSKVYESREAIRKKEKAVEKLQEVLEQAEAIIIGAGAGLSVSAGYTYTGERFNRYFQDFAMRYGFLDMYSGGFYPYNTLEEYWGYWSRYLYINRYMNPPKPVYQTLLKSIKDRDYFVLTTNVDHCFQRAGFDKNRLFYTQGDYGLSQCSKPCHMETYDHEKIIRQMIQTQGFQIDETGTMYLPDGVIAKRTIPRDLILYCPKCKRPMTMNLRVDSSFVEDAGWHRAAKRYEDFLCSHQNKKVLFLELGVGYNTPSIIKYSFWKMTQQWEGAFYACINLGTNDIPEEIVERSICIDYDIGQILELL